VKHPLGRCLLLSGLLLLLWSPGVLAQAQMDSFIYLDFDDDGDPWTLRDTLPMGVTTALVKFVLEVHTLPLADVLVTGSIVEGCCDGPVYDAHYGTHVVEQSVTFDPTYVIDSGVWFPTCTYCCPWMLTLTFNPAAPLVSGQRYFIGQAQWNATCDITDPCSPPTYLGYSFSEIGGSGYLHFGCPVTPAQPESWGRIKSLYR
jgi:hypothetical protein